MLKNKLTVLLIVFPIPFLLGSMTQSLIGKTFVSMVANNALLFSGIFLLLLLLLFYFLIKWLKTKRKIELFFKLSQKYFSEKTNLALNKYASQKDRLQFFQEFLRSLKQYQVEAEQKIWELNGQLRTISEKLQQTETELAVTTSWQNLLNKTGSLGLFVLDQNNCFIDVNQNFCHLVHRQKDFLIGRSINTIFANPTAENHHPFLTFSKNKNESNPTEFYFQLWTGHKVWWKVFNNFNEIKKESYFLIEDMTPLMQKIHDLTQREGHFQLLFNKANDPVFVNQITTNQRFGPFIEVNQKAIDTYLYSREEFKYLNPLTLVPPEHRHRHEQIINRLLKEGHVIYEIEYFRKDKRRIPVEISAHLFEYRNQPTVLSIVRDISERKRAQEALKRSSFRLRRLASRLQEIREEERAMIAREIHDQLGQLLTVLKIEISLLCRQFGPKTPVVQEKIDTISQLINQAVQTVQQISAKLRPGILDEVGLVAAMEWQSEEFSKHTGITCKSYFPKKELKLDKERATALFRIFQEALTNVARHSQAQRVSIFLKQFDQHVILEVIDNGVGINRQQIESPQSLGLLGMRERAMVFGGKVEINGVPGQGTHVKVELPY